MHKSELLTRKIAWEIMKRASYRNKRLSDVTADFFRNERNSLNNQDRRFITMLVQGTVRLSGRLDWELRQVYIGDYQDLKESFCILLRLGVYQLLYMSNVPDYAAVTTTVQLAKRIHNNLGGLANALLRNLIRIEDRVEPDKNSSIAILSNYLSHPEWLITKWMKYYNFDEIMLLAEWNNHNPLLWFRVNQLSYTQDKFKDYLKKNRIEYTQFQHIQFFFQVNNNQKLLNSNIFKDGKISVQDPAAGLVAKLVDPQKDEEIIDACAAPGGKTAYMAELMQGNGKIKAFDSNADRLKILNHTIKRLKLSNVVSKHLDLIKDKFPLTDKMLLDVPCSGTGVMSKRADLRWRRSIDDILEMHLLQRNILWAASKYIKPGGVIIYSTCSIEPEENWMVIDAFLKKHPKFSIQNAKNFLPKKYVDSRGAMFTFPPQHHIDGGFAFRLKRDD